MKTDTYFWPKETTADPYMKQFIEKQGTVSIDFLKLMYKYISRSRSREKNTRLQSRSWSRSRGKMARLRNPAPWGAMLRQKFIPYAESTYNDLMLPSLQCTICTYSVQCAYCTVQRTLIFIVAMQVLRIKGQNCCSWEGICRCTYVCLVEKGWAEVGKVEVGAELGKVTFT